MKFNTIKRKVARHLVNYKGTNLNKKLILIESDDWGSIRMPSKEAYTHLLQKGIVSAKNRYAQFDTLASADDLEALFSILSSHKDNAGNNPKITANTIMCNPDFEKIRADDFNNYYYESFIDTLKSSPETAKSFKIWEQGIQENIFIPQLHGREHINVSKWMEGLRRKDEAYLEAFNYKTFIVDKSVPHPKSESLAAALNFNTDKERDFVTNSLADGYSHFENVFGYASKTFTAPNYTWNDDVDKTTSALGVKTLQSSILQNLVMTNGLENKTVKHHMGEVNKRNQIITVRNCYFEPSLMKNRQNAVENCLKDIETAFFWKKPAIITSHRLNFIGVLDKNNRDENLKMLNKLIKAIIKKWPDAEFSDSVELCNIMHNKNNE